MNGCFYCPYGLWEYTFLIMHLHNLCCSIQLRYLCFYAKGQNQHRDKPMRVIMIFYIGIIYQNKGFNIMSSFTFCLHTRAFTYHNNNKGLQNFVIGNIFRYISLAIFSVNIVRRPILFCWLSINHSVVFIEASQSQTTQ